MSLGVFMRVCACLWEIYKYYAEYKPRKTGFCLLSVLVHSAYFNIIQLDHCLCAFVDVYDSKETWHSPSHRDRLTASRWNWLDNGKICHGNTEREKKREILRVKTKRRKMRNVMEKLVKRRRSS